jgi:cell division protein FtsW
MRTLIPVLLVFGAAAGLVMFQPDLGSVIIAGGITVAVLFAGGVSMAPLALCTVTGAGLAVILTMTASYRRARLLAFLDPWDDPLSTSYQTVQSMVGIANGGVTGVGVGQGRAKWGFLPESHTDFIFAVVAEEMGFIGAVLVLAMFVTLAVVGVRIAQRAPDRFGTLTAIGIVVWLLLQAIVNVGGVVGAMPITGVTLPFVSFGGTSTVVGMAAVGVLLNIGRQGQA